LSRVVTKGFSCFERLGTNGWFFVLSIVFPFILSVSKDSERIFPRGDLDVNRY
jgi:hypothetical protein